MSDLFLVAIPSKAVHSSKHFVRQWRIMVTVSAWIKYLKRLPVICNVKAILKAQNIVALECQQTWFLHEQNSHLFDKECMYNM